MNRIIGFLIVLSLLFSHCCVAQNIIKVDLTPAEIVDKAIESNGGNKAFGEVQSGEFSYTVISQAGDTLYLEEKKDGRSKYFISAISANGKNETIIFNNGIATSIIQDSVKKIVDPYLLEWLQVKCFYSLELAIRQLKYQLTLLADAQCDGHACYVISAVSPLGSKMTVCFDKITGQIRQITQSDKTESKIARYVIQNGLSWPAIIGSSGAANRSTISFLRHMDINKINDTNWFCMPHIGKRTAPKWVKEGNFRYYKSKPGSSIIRENDNHVERYEGLVLKYKIKWLDGYNYELYKYGVTPSPYPYDNILWIRGRILFWIGSVFYCQAFSSNHIGVSCAFEKVNE